MPYKDPAKRREYLEKYREELKKNAEESIMTGIIIDRNKWDVWCNNIKSWTKRKKNPYSAEFTNEMMFNKMILGCFYCGDIANTIDRIDSTLGHTSDNCVGCCYGCNNAKGASDSATFIRKAYYKTRGEYIDDIIDIWFVNKNKPVICDYKKCAEKKGVPFDLTKEDFDTLINGNCAYCQRVPTTWFGIDRECPENGYVLDNVVPCCWDCNLDKHNIDAGSTKKRNEKIANRMVSGELVIKRCDKVFLHNGISKSSKKVCAYGNMYESKIEASRALGDCRTYVKNCIINGKHFDDIFEITDEFYEEYKDFDGITKDMFVKFCNSKA